MTLSLSDIALAAVAIILAIALFHGWGAITSP